MTARIYPRISAKRDIQADRWLTVRNHIRDLHTFLNADALASPQLTQRGGVHLLSPEPNQTKQRAELEAARLASERRLLIDRYLDQLLCASSRLTLMLPGMAEPIVLPVALQPLYTSLSLARVSGGDERLSVFAGLRESRHLILVGPDGAGKSTTIQQLAATMAQAIREPAQQLALLQRLDGWRRGPRLPIRVLLAEAAASEARSPLDQLWAGIPEFAALDLAPHQCELLRDALAHTLEHGQGLLLLDGLDQVPTGAALDAAHAIIAAARERFGASHILVTFRSESYDCHAYRMNEIDSAVLAPFSPRDIDAFVARWYRELAAQGRYSLEQAQQRARALALAIRADSRLTQQACLPQNLAALTLLHSHGAELPVTLVKQLWQHLS